jgi:subtilisin-like proprotein convertase family protein
MSNDSVVYTCGGTFYDSGGDLASYANGEVLTRTFCSDNPGTQISINFSAFNSEQCCDHLYIYDGATTSGTPLIQAEGVNPFSLIGHDFVSTSGCLTFKWISDGSVSNSGWIAQLSCLAPCQPFQLQVTSDVPAQNNTIHLCHDQLIHFGANGVYNHNDSLYHQSDSTSICKWYVNGELQHTGFAYDFLYSNGTIFVQAELTDSSGCTANVNYLVSGAFNLSIIQSPLNLSTYWIGQQINLVADTICSFYMNETITDSVPMYLPDGQGVPYEKVIQVMNSDPGRTIQNPTDVQSVCLNIEHSFVGDLSIHLICPNGQFLDILTYPDGLGSTWFGVPIDNDANTSPGVGWTYCWTPTATNPIPNTSGASVPAGNYQPTGPFSALVGCPINGDWIIRVEDYLGSDNGYIFNVDLTFDTNIVHSQTVDTINNFSWSGPNILPVNSNIVTAPSNVPGTYTYTFSAQNSCGDTLIQYVTVNVIDTPAFISGKVFMDINQDCAFDGGDINQTNRIIEFSPGAYFASTDASGNYMAAIPQGEYTVTVAPIANISNLCPAQHSYSVQVTRGDTLANINFGDTLLPYHDMSVFLGSSMAVMGNEFTLNLILANYGNTPYSGVLNLQTDSTFAFVSCNNSCASSSNGKVDFGYSSVAPGATVYLSAIFQIPVNVDLIGTTFTTKAWFDSIPTDVYLVNNQDSISSLIRASFDPNIKTVMPVGFGDSGDIMVNDSTLKYTIHFQNTGNWPATNIIIKDTLSAFVDPATIEPGPSSHPYTFNLSGQGVAEFRFMNIMLTDSGTNQVESNGYVCYRIKQRNNNPGTEIKNTADIYFDYNPLVATNTALNTIAWPLSTTTVIKNKHLAVVHPNPVLNNLYIDFSNSAGVNTVEISSVTGEFIASYHYNNISGAEISMKNLSKGIYIVKIISASSTDVQRVVKM